LPSERAASQSDSSTTPTKHKNDQFAIDPPRNVQSILLQSPPPVKVAPAGHRLGRVPLQPALAGGHKRAKAAHDHQQCRAPEVGDAPAGRRCQAGEQSNQDQGVTLHDTHRARLQAHHMLQVHAICKQ
jgi:hypothetical protein